MCNPVPPDPQARALERYKHIWERYKHVREEIGREWTNITSRIGWLVTSQAFLFAALRLGCTSGATPPGDLFPLLPLIGIGASLSVFISVLAALHRIRALRGQQRACSVYLKGAKTALGGCDATACAALNLDMSPRATHVAGALPTLVLPIFLLLAWLHVLGTGGLGDVAVWIADPNNVLVIWVYGLIFLTGTFFWFAEVCAKQGERRYLFTGLGVVCALVLLLVVMEYWQLAIAGKRLTAPFGHYLFWTLLPLLLVIGAGVCFALCFWKDKPPGIG